MRNEFSLIPASFSLSGQVLCSNGSYVEPSMKGQASCVWSAICHYGNKRMDPEKFVSSFWKLLAGFPVIFISE